MNLAAIALAVALACGASFVAGARHGAAKVEARVTRERQADADAQRLAALEVQRFERQAQARQQEAQDARDRELQTVAAAAGRLRRQLRERAPRPVVVAGGSSTPPARACCSGAELCREDAGFLVGEAARGDALRVELHTCQAERWKLWRDHERLQGR